MALLVLTLAMLLGYGFMMRQPQAMKRLDAGDEALRAIESSLETLRSGAIPVQPSRMLQPVIAYPPPTAAADLLINLEVEPTAIDGLFLVSLEARYRVGRAIHRRHVQSQIWSP
jgi:hypothetical protein